MILMIDNYDSFTYNLVQYLGELKADVKVFRNDKIDIHEIDRLKPEKIIISPGPKNPKDAGISNDVIREYTGKIPLLGVCLGHQCIGYVFGGNIVRADVLMHGKTSDIYHNKKGLFKELSNPFLAARYHSLLIDRESVPKCLEVTAWTKDKCIMGIKHKKHQVYGVQFHPESILTKEGKKILENFLKFK
jgi:anthranilate synthase/aminodeoxychorismate synthase-like glutamine amidotransferase